MITIHLGVIDLPYSYAPPAVTMTTGKRKKRRRPRRRKRGGGISTGDVANILEAKYHVMEVFWQLHQTEVMHELEESLAGSLETLLMGGPISDSPYAAASSKIEDHFKQFLSTKEIEGIGIPGVPTEAALLGHSHRFLHPYARRPPRPSFIDTGLYQSSFRTWVD